jgi:hypothetical protein
MIKIKGFKSGVKMVKMGIVEFSIAILFTIKEPAGGPINGTMQPERVAS